MNDIPQGGLGYGGVGLRPIVDYQKTYLETAEKILALPEREWDIHDADSAEARSARAYNSALANVWIIIRENH